MILYKINYNFKEIRFYEIFHFCHLHNKKVKTFTYFTEL